MATFIQEQLTTHTPETLAAQLAGVPGRVLLHSALPDSPASRYSFVTAQPFLTFRSFGTHGQIRTPQRTWDQEGNPWQLLTTLLDRYELPDAWDQPFPLGGAFGYWGYGLKHFVEPKLLRRCVDDLGLPDCHVGFHDSLVVFDHQGQRVWIVSTGLQLDGSRDERAARAACEFWRDQLLRPAALSPHRPTAGPSGCVETVSSLDRPEFVARVERIQRYIRAGDIYQANLARRLTVPSQGDAWELYQALVAASPAPFAAFLDCDEFQLASSSPELFLRLSGSEMVTRPIKGTRPRSEWPDRDTQLAYELQTSPKEMAELVMITDLLRNDLGRVCEYGSIHVPELARLERYAFVQHLVSTVSGRLRPGLSHAAALAACFPGGSVTGAPKIRAMDVIEELESVARGPYTGCLGYLGFNRESQLSIIIRTAVHRQHAVHFHTGAGIVADSDPEAEFEETSVKALGFLAALGRPSPRFAVPCPASTRRSRA